MQPVSALRCYPVLCRNAGIKLPSSQSVCPPKCRPLTGAPAPPDTGGMTKPAATAATVAAAKPVHIFKPGRWTTMGGETIEFSEADLRATAAAFNPALSKAPIVIGHPATDDPAQGWVASLSASARGLFAVPAQVDPAFAQAANAGRYGTVSAKFYRPTDASNPVPGVWYLRHVGVLGAQSPAVKGLDSPAFAGADNDDGCVCFQEGIAFSAWEDQTNASLWRRMRDWLIGDKGQTVADEVLPGYLVQSLEQAAQDELRESLTKQADPEATVWRAAQPAAFSDPTPVVTETPHVTPEEKAALLLRNTELEGQLAQLHAAQAAAQSAQTHAAHVAFCEDLAAQARLLPASQALAVATLDHLAAQAEPVQFGEAGAQAPLLDGFKAFLTALPAQVSFGEHATHDRAAGGAAVDLNDAEAISAQAKAYQTQAERSGQSLSHAQAVSQVVRGR